MITILNLFKQYGNKEVLKDLNITFEKGAVYGIVGENGAGKTTLFRCIAGLEAYNGQINSELNPLKEHLGFLMAEPFFFSKITGKEYIRFLCNARKKETSNIDDKNIFDLPLNDYVSTYSSGMKKKLALIAVLLQGNRCFLFDEPFNGIDIQSNIVIAELMRKLKSLDKTVIISSHIFSTLSETCDEIFLLKDGKIAKRVFREEFNALEEELKAFAIGNKIEKLRLSR